MTKPMIYFLCVGNSCRSQMAEGFARQLLGEHYEIWSAGIEPSAVHPYAVQVMAEIGIDISYQQAKLIDIKRVHNADIVITLCKDAQERCPAIMPRSYHYHWGLDDPAQAQGTEQEVIDEFRRVRDELLQMMKQFIAGDAGVSIHTNRHEFDEWVLKPQFGVTLQHLRERALMTEVQLAEQLHVSETFLQRTERSETVPSKFFLHRLSIVLNMPYEALMTQLFDRVTLKR